MFNYVRRPKYTEAKFFALAALKPMKSYLMFEYNLDEKIYILFYFNKFSGSCVLLTFCE